MATVTLKFEGTFNNLIDFLNNHPALSDPRKKIQLLSTTITWDDDYKPDSALKTLADRISSISGVALLPSTVDRIDNMVRLNKILPAIKLVRELTGCTLKAAKNVVDEIISSNLNGST